MQPTILTFIITLLVFTSVESANGQIKPDALELGREMVDQYMAKTGTPGLSVAVQVRDSLVWVEGFGLADVEHNVPVQIYTKFRAASVSKALTSIAVGLLHEQNRLDIDAPVQTYVPSFPEKEHPITTRQLGGHLSGLPNKQEDEYINVIHYNSVIDALDTFKDRSLLFPPGQRFYYSNFGYTLISAVIEGASGWNIWALQSSSRSG